MYMNTRFSILLSGWAVLTPDEARKARKAMNEYRREHPACELTGSTKKVQIHHIIPVWKAPHLAADKNNMIALSICANIHHIFGHDRSYQNRYVTNIREIADQVAVLRASSEIEVRPEEVKPLSFNRGGWFKTLVIKIYAKLFDI